MKNFLKKGTKLKKYKLTKRESNSKLSPSFLFMVYLGPLKVLNDTKLTLNESGV